MVTNPCIKCSAPIPYEPIDGFPKMFPTICDSCAERERKLVEANLRRERQSRFDLMCPAAYRQTDPNHPGMPPAAKLNAILGWKPGPKGLVVYGETRRGKTRAVWLLIKQLVLDGFMVKAFQPGDLVDEVSENAADLSDWREEMLAADVVFIDDFGKWKLTERLEAELFDLINRRTSNLKPFILTTNFVGEELARKFSEDRGLPLVERIREFCIPVSLKQKPKA